MRRAAGSGPALAPALASMTAAPDDDDTNFSNLVNAFRENGVVVVPGALSPAEVEAARAVLAADRAARPAEWKLTHTHSRGVGPAILSRTRAFDRIASLRRSPVRALVERLFAPRTPHLCGLSFFVREANPTMAGGDPTDPACVTRVWHREFGGQIGLAPESEFFVSSLQVFYYLDDCLSTDGHTLAIVPESVEDKRRLPIITDNSGRVRIDDSQRQPPWPRFATWQDSLGRQQVLRQDGIDIFAPAGSAILMNNTSIHAGAVRQTSQMRRTISAVYRAEEPLSSFHGLSADAETGQQEHNSVHEFRKSLPLRLRGGTTSSRL